MIEPTIIKIPTRSHLKKFLLKTYDAREPFKLDEKSGIGKNLMSSMVDKLEYINANDQLTETLHVILSKRFTERGPRIKRLVYINSLIEEMFKEAMILWIFAKSTEGINPNQSTKDFLSFFCIDESEYTYDAAYKLWQRYKSRNPNWVRKFPQKTAKFTPNLSAGR